MTPKEVLKQLKARGTEANRKHNAKWGAGGNQFGVKHGDIRMLAKRTIGDKLGIYRDYPVSKGCTSCFASIWINAIVSGQG